MTTHDYRLTVVDDIIIATCSACGLCRRSRLDHGLDVSYMPGCPGKVATSHGWTFHAQRVGLEGVAYVICPSCGTARRERAAEGGLDALAPIDLSGECSSVAVAA